jgi:hypothetical protein
MTPEEKYRVENEIRYHPLMSRVPAREVNTAVAHAVRYATRKHYRLPLREAIQCGIDRAAEARRMRSHDTGYA